VDVHDPVIGENMGYRTRLAETLAQFRNAVRNDVSQDIETMFRERVDVNHIFPDQTPVLCYAIQKNAVGVTRELLRLGANPRITMPDGSTGMFIACRKGLNRIVDVLLQYYQELLHERYLGETPLATALMFRHLEVTRTLVGWGADVNQPFMQNGVFHHTTDTYLVLSPILLAVFDGQIDSVNFLLKHGADVNHSLLDGRTALFLACYLGDVEIAAALVTTGALMVPEEGERMRLSPWWVATAEARPEIIDVLVNTGYPFNVRVGGDGESLLHVAAQVGNAEIVSALISKGADVNARDDDDKTALHWAVANDMEAVVDVLLQNGASTTALSSIGYSPLHKAAWNGSLTMMRMLIAYEANVNLSFDNGRTPLMLAAEYAQFQACVLLIDAGADINQCGRDGITALMYATKRGNYDISDLLCWRGADAGMRLRSTGQRALDLIHGHITLRSERSRDLLMCVNEAQESARNEAWNFFQEKLEGGDHAIFQLPYAAWVPFLPEATRTCASLWIDSCLADARACFAAFFHDTYGEDVELRRYTDHEGPVSELLSEFMVHRDPFRLNLHQLKMMLM